MNDPVCYVCGELKSAHVATERGEFTHPREARGEGRYVQTARGWRFLPSGGLKPIDLCDIRKLSAEMGTTYRPVRR